MEPKGRGTYTVNKKILDEFNRAKGCYSKSALIESFIVEFLKKNKGLIP